MNAPRTKVSTAVTVEVRDLVKRYPKRPVNAVDGLSFTVAQGEVFGLLGPNGAGKTTTIGILTTRVRRTGGMALVAGVDVGVDPRRARRLVGVVPQHNNLDRALSIRRNLLFHAAYHGVPSAERTRRADRLLEEFGLADRANDWVEMVSGGQSQRVMIARALMHAPPILFLDEPTAGLDPAARLFVWERLRDLRARGLTIVLTTHDMDEAAALADRVGIMDHGRLLALDAPEALTRSLVPRRSILEVAIVLAPGAAVQELLAELSALDGVQRVEQIETGYAAVHWAGAGGRGLGTADAKEAHGSSAGLAKGGGPPRELRARLFVPDNAPMTIAPLVALLTARGSILTDFTISTPSLEDVFIHLTGRALR